jgi:hypothetical protein
MTDIDRIDVTARYLQDCDRGGAETDVAASRPRKGVVAPNRTRDRLLRSIISTINLVTFVKTHRLSSSNHRHISVAAYIIGEYMT